MPNVNDSPYKGSGSLTRAQFLYYEMRTTARLMTELQSDEEVIKRIISENLFQYPTEKSLKLQGTVFRVFMPWRTKALSRQSPIWIRKRESRSVSML